jgi:hypothetical protein
MYVNVIIGDVGAWLVRPLVPLRMMGFTVTAIEHKGSTERDPCALDTPKIIQQNIEWYSSLSSSS